MNIDAKLELEVDVEGSVDMMDYGEGRGMDGDGWMRRRGAASRRRSLRRTTVQYTAIVQHTAPSREATTQLYSRFVDIPRCPA